MRVPLSYFFLEKLYAFIVVRTLFPRLFFLLKPIIRPVVLEVQ